MISHWNDERGFGFVMPDDGGDRAFAHISEFRARSRRPIVGDRVTYSPGRDARGRLRARAVGFVDAKPSLHASRSSVPRSAIGIAALAAVAIAFFAGVLPPLLAGSYIVLSGLSFLLYAKDKSAAKRKAWRTPEHTLIILDLLGGWPGGLVAQQSFHHKTVKQPFQLVFWLSVLANIGGLFWLISSGMAAYLSAAIPG